MNDGIARFALFLCKSNVQAMCSSFSHIDASFGVALDGTSPFLAITLGPSYTYVSGMNLLTQGVQRPDRTYLVKVGSDQDEICTQDPNLQ